MATCLYFIVDNTCGRRKGLFVGVFFWGGGGGADTIKKSASQK